MKRLLPFLLFVGLAGCDLYGPVCTDIAIPAISVTVNDSTTNQPVSAGNLMVVAKTTTYSDTLRATITPNNSIVWALAYEHPGNYTVEVSVSGYHPWSVNNILVVKDECHVQTRTVTARLQPAP